MKVVQKEGIRRDEKLYRHRFVAGLIKLLVEDFMENSKEGTKKYRQTTPICVTFRCKRNTARRLFQRNSDTAKKT